MYTDKLGLLLRYRRTRRLQPVLRPGRGHVGLLPGARGVRIRGDGMEGQGVAQRDLGTEPDPRLPGDVRGDHQGIVAAHRHRRHLRHPRGGGQPGVRGAPRPGAHRRSGEPHPRRPERRQLSRRSGSDVAPVVADPAHIEAAAYAFAEALKPASKSSRWSASVRYEATRSRAVKRLHRAVPDSAADHPGRQGHRL